MLTQEEEVYFKSRASSIENVEKALAEITQVFMRFGEIVNEQQMMVERIDSTTEDAVVNIEKAKTQLVEHYQNVSSVRNLMIKIFLILVLMATLYILFFV